MFVHVCPSFKFDFTFETSNFMIIYMNSIGISRAENFGAQSAPVAKIYLFGRDRLWAQVQFSFDLDIKNRHCGLTQ